MIQIFIKNKIKYILSLIFTIKSFIYTNIIHYLNHNPPTHFTLESFKILVMVYPASDYLSLSILYPVYDVPDPFIVLTRLLSKLLRNNYVLIIWFQLLNFQSLWMWYASSTKKPFMYYKSSIIASFEWAERGQR